MPDAFPEALRDGLRGLPVPAVSGDFDVRILAALQAPLPWWRCWWQPARPLLAGASFSLLVTLALLHWTLLAPVPLSARASPAGIGAGGLSAAAPSLDALLNRPCLTAGSLAAAWNSPPDAAPPDDRHPAPRRRAQVFRRACPVA